jgi:predicted transcriptional regulator
METVADVLRHKFPQFNTIGPDRSMTDALHQMHCENVDYLVVLDDDERFLGVLTEHNVADKVVYRSGQLEFTKVRDFMSTYLPIATTNNSLEYCMQLMDKYNVRHVVVYDRFTFKGVISSHELMKHILLKRRVTFSEESETFTHWSY